MEELKSTQEVVAQVKSPLEWISTTEASNIYQNKLKMEFSDKTKTDSLPCFGMSKILRYIALSKPGIVLGNAVTTAGGFAIGSRHELDFRLLGLVLTGLSCVIAAACVCNNCIDRGTDAKMARTSHRVLATGELSWKQAMPFAAVLGVFGLITLLLSAPLIAVLATVVGFGAYVLLYGMGKYLSLYATLVGSVAGAVPPVVGYCAAANTFDAGALLLGCSMVCWQMPHFYSIAIFRLDEYASTSLSVLPVQKGIFITKVRMLGYIVVWTVLSCMLSVFGYTGWLVFVVAAALGCSWGWLCLQGFSVCNERAWARRMFFWSLVNVGLSNVLYVLRL
jgi:protoheme IX farnesyltransferase